MLRSFLMYSLVLLTVTTVSAQKTASASFVFEPAVVEMSVGDTATVQIRFVDATDALVAEPFLMFARGQRAVEILNRSSNPDGTATTRIVAHRPGEYTLTARSLGGPETRISGRLPINVSFPPLQAIRFIQPPTTVYTGTATPLIAEVVDAAGLVRDEVTLHLSSDHPDRAALDAYHTLTALMPGEVTVTARAAELTASITISVMPNPVAQIRLRVDQDEARTGDVIHFNAECLASDGTSVTEVPVAYAVQARPDDFRGARASGQVMPDGRFVADTPGLYTIIASSGTAMARHTVRIHQRDVKREVTLLGHGPVLDVHTSDLWVWEGMDGRDYAVTGTWSARGDAFFWDVTDPTNMVIIDTLTVDARTVNDVKVSADGAVCVISREGASSRRNGIVILDCTDPSQVSILSEYDEGLTGGVHNVFIYENHVYAVNNGRRYDIINIEDPRNPYRVSRFELGTPGHAIHDVWVKDGIAYSSNWGDGVHMIDIGSASESGALVESDEAPIPDLRAGLVGGSPRNPIPVTSYQYPSGWNHAAFPFHSTSTGKFYVVAGDEAFPWGRISEQAPERAGGWLHFVDFTDLENPEETARYEVPEAGSHNYWIEDDILYAGYYNGGLRIVDISGELMGDLYRQGREIAHFLPSHPDAVIRNAPMVWGVQPHKGVLFVADHYSGLWAVKLAD